MTCPFIDKDTVPGDMTVPSNDDDDDDDDHLYGSGVNLERRTEDQVQAVSEDDIRSIDGPVQSTCLKG